MPFFDDSGVRPEEHKGPIWSAFAVLGDQVERLVALNIAWSIHLVPMLLGLGFSEWPTGLRILLVAYTGLVLGPATGALYGLVAQVVRGELLRAELAVDVLRVVFQPSLVTLVPLYSGFAWLAAAAWLVATVQLPVVDVLVQVIALLLALCSIYWGPLFALQPGLSAWGILRESVRLVWRQPGETLRSALVILAALALGVVSVGGTFLIVPVAVALLQVELCRSVTRG